MECCAPSSRKVVAKTTAVRDVGRNSVPWNLLVILHSRESSDGAYRPLVGRRSASMDIGQIAVDIRIWPWAFVELVCEPLS